MGTRFTPFYFRLSLINLKGFLLIGLLSVTGCATMAPEPARVPEPTEKIVFKEVSTFYCAKKRWPQSWDELIHFEDLSPEGHHAVGEMLTPALSSPRALLLTIRYKNVQGVDRKVTYIAPPDCGKKENESIVSMVGGRVSFKRPKGYQPLKAAEIKAKWKDGPYPDVAWQDPSRSVFITVSFGEVPVEPSDLEVLKEELEAAYEGSLPGATWIERSLAADEEPPKLIHMLSSDGPSGKALTYSMSMSFDGRLLTVAVLGPEDRQREVEEVGNSLRRSISVR